MALESGKEIVVIDDQPKVMSRRFHLFPEIRSNAIFSLDDDAILNVQEVCVNTLKHARQGFG